MYSIVIQSSILVFTIFKNKKQLSNKEEELLLEKTRLGQIQKDNEKLAATIANREEYISTLPTEDEVKRSDEEVGVFSLDEYLFLFFVTEYFFSSRKTSWQTRMRI